jgi:hypothetical protein
MTHAKDSIACPRYTALDFDGECAASDDSLAVVLAALRHDFDPDAGEELCIWKDGTTIAAIQKADGRIIELEPDEAPPRKPSKPANGNGRGRGRRP